MSKEQLGLRIKRLRELNEMSLDQLAERTGLGLEFLQSLENESAYPSLGPLLKVARALGVRLGTFLDDELGQDPLIIRLDERVGALSMLGDRSSSVEMTYYSLGKGKKDRHMEPFFIEMMPPVKKDVKLSSHEGEEFIVVHSGSIEITYGKDHYVLHKGDSIYLNSIIPHHVACSEQGPASIYAVLFFPE